MAEASMMGDDVTAPQASSQFELEPISAAVLLRRETKRRDALWERGPVRVGCREVDDYVLMDGGLERGSVVGISAESEQMGLLISMQAIAGELCGSDSSRAMVVTTQPPAVLLPNLRDAVKTELAARGVPVTEVRYRLRSCLERVSVSRVFDLDGVWEVLGDLDIPPSPSLSPVSMGSPVPAAEEEFPAKTQSQSSEEQEAERIVLPELKPEPVVRPSQRGEIADSDEEDGLSPPPSSSVISSLSPPPSSMASMLASPEPQEVDGSQASEALTFDGEVSEELEEQLQQAPQEEAPEVMEAIEAPEAIEEGQPTAAQPRPDTPARETKHNAHPDIILITHFSTLMTALFTRHDRVFAHDELHDLSAHLRYLSRSLPSSPLVLVLNSTSAPKKPKKEAPDPKTYDAAQDEGGAPRPADENSPAKKSARPLDPTLRSVFNPPEMDIPGYVSRAHARRNKPAFGLVFSQLLDLHLLCTRMPRSQEDVDRLAAAAEEEGDERVRYVWIVEVLLDEAGVWEPDTGPGARRSREQRWAAVDVRAGRVVDAFDEEVQPKKHAGDVRTVGGFGGPRV
ncbi:fasciclin domain family [Colletotrichum plurivorum]|uniref:Fasciclin domain family n=1 Tax=Colletotrichum plurivorum TaxID=2175906 RepID=A0A8H6N7C9_9PEZI|nr:fasciclin domain family [Colletotrichum plurivorum]